MDAEPVGTEPVGTDLLFENDRVRVWEMVLPPGATCDAHRHDHDYLMLYPTPSAIRSALDDGRAVIQHVDAGLVAYRAVGASGLDPHAITNAGGTTSHHFVVELLGGSTERTARPIEHNGRGRTELLSASDG